MPQFISGITFDKKKKLPSSTDLTATSRPADPMKGIDPYAKPVKAPFQAKPSGTQILQRNPSTLEGAMAKLNAEYGDRMDDTTRNALKYTLQRFLAERPDFKGDLLEAAKGAQVLLPEKGPYAKPMPTRNTGAAQLDAAYFRVYGKPLTLKERNRLLRTKSISGKGTLAEEVLALDASQAVTGTEMKGLLGIGKPGTSDHNPNDPLQVLAKKYIKDPVVNAGRWAVDKTIQASNPPAGAESEAGQQRMRDVATFVNPTELVGQIASFDPVATGMVIAGAGGIGRYAKELAVGKEATRDAFSKAAAKYTPRVGPGFDTTVTIPKQEIPKFTPKVEPNYAPGETPNLAGMAKPRVVDGGKMGQDATRPVPNIQAGEAKPGQLVSIPTKLVEKTGGANTLGVPRRVKAGTVVDGLTVGEKISNRSSADGWFNSQKTLPGVYEIPLGDITQPYHRAADARNLAAAIGESGRIDPLIVAIGRDGTVEIIEGAHRLAALRAMGKKSFPAMVVKESPPTFTVSKMGDKFAVHPEGRSNAGDIVSRHATADEAWDAADEATQSSAKVVETPTPVVTAQNVKGYSPEPAITAKVGDQAGVNTKHREFETDLATWDRTTHPGKSTSINGQLNIAPGRPSTHSLIVKTSGGLDFADVPGKFNGESLTEAHEVMHGYFSADPDAGHRAMKALRGYYGEEPGEGALEALMDLGRTYAISPNWLEHEHRDLYRIAREWLGDNPVKSIADANARMAEEAILRRGASGGPMARRKVGGVGLDVQTVGADTGNPPPKVEPPVAAQNVKPSKTVGVESPTPVKGTPKSADVPTSKPVAEKPLEAPQPKTGPKSIVDMTPEEFAAHKAGLGVPAKAPKNIAEYRAAKKGMSEDERIVALRNLRASAASSAAKGRTAKRGGGTIGKADIDIAVEFAEVYVIKGAKTVETLAKHMVDEFGEAIRPHMEAIAKRVGITAREAAETPVRGAEGPKTTTPGAIPSTQALRNEVANETRRAMGLEDVPEADRMSFARAVDDAADRAKSDPSTHEKALSRADDINTGRSKEPLTIAEDADNLVARKQLTKKYNDLTAKIANSRGDKVELERLNAERDVLRSQYESLTDASKSQGTDIARRMAFRREDIDDDFTALGMKSRASANKRTGDLGPLTTKESAAFDEMALKIEEREAAVALKEAALKEADAAAYIRATRRARTPANEAPAARLERLSKERTDLVSQFAKLTTEISMNIDPAKMGAAVHIARRLAANLYDTGITEIKVIAKEIAKLLNITDDDALDLLAHRSDKKPSEAAKTGAKIVREARKLRPDAAADAVAEAKKLADVKVKTSDAERVLESGTPEELEKLVRGDKTRRKASDELEAARAYLMLLKGQARRRIAEAGISRTSKVIRGSAQLVRGTILGQDLGIMFRQGAAILAQPKSWGKGFTNALKAARSDTAMATLETQMRHMVTDDGRMAEPIFKRVGVSTSDYLVDPEEMILGRTIRGIADHIPWVGEWVSDRVGTFDRFQAALINTARRDVMLRAINAGDADRALQVRAHYLNAVTGRSNLKRVGDAAQLVFTSPRYEVSRWETIFEPMRNSALVVSDLATGKGLNVGALRNMKDMAVTAAEFYATVKIANQFGYEFEFQSDGLKLRKGDKVWAVDAGISPRLMTIYNLVDAYFNTDSEKTWQGEIAKAAKRSISPAVTTPTTQSSVIYQRKHGVAEDDIKDVWTGYKLDPHEKGWQTALPLIYQATLAELQGGHGAVSAFDSYIKEFVGTAVNRYPKRGSSSSKTKTSKSGG